MSDIVLARIAAWEAAGLIDATTAERLRAAEADEPADADAATDGATAAPARPADRSLIVLRARGVARRGVLVSRRGVRPGRLVCADRTGLRASGRGDPRLAARRRPRRAGGGVLRDRARAPRPLRSALARRWRRVPGLGRVRRERRRDQRRDRGGRRGDGPRRYRRRAPRGDGVSLVPPVGADRGRAAGDDHGGRSGVARVARRAAGPGQRGLRRNLRRVRRPRCRHLGQSRGWAARS